MAELAHEQVTIIIADGKLQVDKEDVRLNIDEDKQVKWKMLEDKKDFDVHFSESPFDDDHFNKNKPDSGKVKPGSLKPEEKERRFKYEVQVDDLKLDPGIIVWKS